MRKRLLAFMVALLVVNLTMPKAVGARSQDNDQARKIEKLKSDIKKLGVGKDARVEVRLRDRKKVKGYIREVREDEFVVVDEKTGTDVTVPYAAVADLKGHNKLTAAKVGITIVKTVAIVAVVAAIVTLLGYLLVPKT